MRLWQCFITICSASELDHNCVMCALSDGIAKSSVVLDRELDQEKSLDPSGPRIRCPLCGWSPRNDDRWSCTCGHSWNTFDTGGVCPPASISGLRLSVSSVVAGGRIRIGTSNDQISTCSVCPRTNPKNCPLRYRLRTET